ncbi:MAG: hypothetical protein ACREPM_24100, partial [Gemmatimonadaceae bacterium]
MKPRIVLTIGFVVGAAAGAQAQASNCQGGTPGTPAQITQDACQKAVDLFQYMAPQLGGAIVGGNATLGQGGVLGGLGHFSIGIRANVIQGSVPKINDAAATPVPTGARATTYATSDTPLPMPTADVELGLYRGFPLGLTNVLGLDALASVAYIPKVDESNVSVEPDNPVKLGYGVRVGLLQESIVTPALSVTYLKRDLPVLAMTGTASGATLSVTNFDEETSAWRIVASKSLIVFGIALGIGQDKYTSSASASATSLGQTSTSVSVSQEMSRTNVFGDLSLNMPIVKVVLEAGQVTGGAAPTTLNQFNGKGIVDSRLYGSFGLR